MTRIGAIRFTIPRSRNAASDCPASGQFRGKHAINTSTPSDTSLSKIARVMGISLIRYAEKPCALWVAPGGLGTWLYEVAYESGDYKSKWKGEA